MQRFVDKNAIKNFFNSITLAQWQYISILLSCIIVYQQIILFNRIDYYDDAEIGLQNTYYINNTVKVVEYVAEASNDIRFDQNDWEQKFEMQQKKLFEAPHNSVPSYLKNIYKEDYSTSYFNSSTSVSGIHWGILHNVCYDIKHNKLHLYKKDGGRSLLPEHFQRDYGSLWTIVEEDSSIPSSLSFTSRSDVWMILPYNEQNIPHFVETHNFILYSAFHQTDFPPVHVVYSPLYHSHSDNEWIVQYMTTMASIYPNSQALELYSYEDMIDMYTKGVVCFKNLNVAGRMDHVTAGGIFVTKQESVYFRALIYKRSNVFPHIDKKFLTNGLMVLRDSTGKSQKNPGRVFVNMDDIHSLFVEINNYFSFKEVYFEKIVFKEQVLMMAETDILVGAHGAGLMNLMFLTPYSVVIDIFEPLYDEKWYNQLSQVTNLFYIPYHNFSANYPMECAESKNMDTILSPCLQAIKKQNIYVNVHLLRSLLLQARIFLSNKKYSY